MENGTKTRLFYLYHILIEQSDMEHPITSVQLINRLKEQYQITVNRNTLANDMEIMVNSGFHIEVIHSTQNKYYYDGHTFELPELKLLIDAVSSSKFITQKKSEELISKLLSLTSSYRAAQLERHVYAAERVKTDNEKGYYIVDAINTAIDQKKKISFQYTDFDANKQRVVRHDGRPYIVSPYAMIWDGDYYYVIGYCDSHEKVQTFRLDRIAQEPELLKEEALPQPESFNLAAYSKSVFRMYDTDEPVEVLLLCRNSIMKAVIDNFGMDVDTQIVDDDHFAANVYVCPSPTFYRWVFGWSGDVKILGPENVVKAYRKMARKALK